jgi:hypothetical protein
MSRPSASNPYKDRACEISLSASPAMERFVAGQCAMGGITKFSLMTIDSKTLSRVGRPWRKPKSESQS